MKNRKPSFLSWSASIRALLLGTTWLSLCAAPLQSATLPVTQGLALRLESINGVTRSGTNVSIWADQSGNAHNATQPNLNRQPAFITNALPSGAPVLRFDGTTDVLTLAGQVVSSESFSIFAVVRATPANNGNKNLFGNWSSAVGRFGSSLFIGIAGYNATSESATVRFTDAMTSAGLAKNVKTPFLLDFVNDTTSNVGQVSQNGLILASKTAVTGRDLSTDPDRGPYIIGAQGDPDHGGSAGENWTGDIAAILIYDAALTSTEQNQVRQYLMDTYLEPVPPTILSVSPVANSIQENLTSINVVFSEAVAHVDAADLLINGAPATSVTPISNREYKFTFAQPALGTVNVSFAGNHGITDLAATPNAFTGTTWTYTRGDNVPPLVLVLDPPRNSTVSNLTSITVTFNEGVANVDASDLLVNGSAVATAVTKISPRIYTFTVPSIATGTANISFAANHGITDVAATPNAFAGLTWTVKVDPKFPGLVTEGLSLQLESLNGVITDSTGHVTDWLDLSGNGHNAFQTNVDRQPLFLTNAIATGLPSVRLDGTDDLLTLTGQIITTEDFTILAVVNGTSPGTGNKNLFGNWSSAAGNFGTSLFVGIAGYQPETDSAVVRFTDNQLNAGRVISLGTPFLLDFRNQAASDVDGFTQVGQDTVQIFSGPSLSPRNLSSDPDIAPYVIGSQGDPDHGGSAGEYWNGNIAALLVYDRRLDDAEFAAVRQYLRNRYLEPLAPVIASVTPATNSVVAGINQVTIKFSEPVAGVDLKDLFINSVAAATNIIVVSAREYTFQFPSPPEGTVRFNFLSNHGITDLSSSSNAFVGITFNITRGDFTAPTVVLTDPPMNTTVPSLGSVKIIFNESVKGIDKGDLLVNGVAATNMTPGSLREYTFQFPSVTSGNATVSFAANHGITDFSTSSNAFAGATWTYKVDPSAPALVSAGLVMRLESISGVARDATDHVSAWSDLSGLGHSGTQASAVRQPLYVAGATASGAPAVRFDGENDMITLAGQVITSENFTIFSVVNAKPSNGGNKNLFGNWSSGAGNFNTSVFLGIAGYDSALDTAQVRFTDMFASAGTAEGVGNHFILDFITDNNPDTGFSDVEQNGVSLFGAGPLTGRNLSSNPDTAPYVIGAQGDGDHGGTAGEYWTGDVAALLVYDRALTEAERSQVRDYLRSVYLTKPVVGPKLSITVANNTVTISWDQTGTLQSAPTVKGPWGDEAGLSPKQFQPTGVAKFFRVRQ